MTNRTFTTAAREAIRSAAPCATVTLHHPYGAPDVLALDLISVPRSEQRHGQGTQALAALTTLADRHGLTLALTPDSGFGTPMTVLHRFYRAHGFHPNRSRLELSYAWIREPLDITAPSA